MLCGEGKLEGQMVALLAEGVDRNLSDPEVLKELRRRPPRGGRG